MNVFNKLLSIILLVTIFFNGNTTSSACTTGEFKVHPTECTLFYFCENNNWRVRNCPGSLHFSKLINACDWPHNANCEIGDKIDPTVPQTSCPAVDPIDHTVHLPHADCSKFYKCERGEAHERSCPEGLHWSIEQDWCDFPERANCTDNAAPTQLPPSSTTTLPPNNNVTNPINTTQPPINNGTTTAIPPGQPNSCPATNPPYDVLLPHPNCTMFYKCLDGVAHEMVCPPGLHWNNNLTICDWPANAQCENNAVPPQPTPPPTTQPPINNGTTTPLPPTAQPPPSSCPAVDPIDHTVHLPHPDCTMFYKCERGEAHERSCPPGLHWSIAYEWCDFPDRANCTDNAAPWQPPVSSTTTSPPNNNVTNPINTTQPPNNNGTTTPINNGTTTPIPPGQPNSCPATNPPYDVLLPHPNCTMFYKCLDGVAHEIACPPGLHWNNNLTICDWPANAQCENNAVPPQPTPPPTTQPPINNGTTTPLPPTAQPPPSSCPAVDPIDHTVHLPHPDCTMFYKCERGEAHERSCPPGLHWSIAYEWCDFPDRANCTDNAAPWQPPVSSTTTSPPNNNVTNPINTTQPPNNNGTTTPINNGTTTPIPPGQPNSCPATNPPYDVLLPHPNCTMFYKCLNGVAHEIACPPGLHWNNNLTICDWPANAQCENNAVPPQPTPPTTQPPINNGTTTTPSPITGSPPSTPPQSCPAQDPIDHTVHLPHPNCTMFYKCENGNAIPVPCPPGLHWSIASDWCDHPELAQCIYGEAPPQPTKY